MLRDLTERDYKKTIGKSSKIQVVVFWAPWSIACFPITEFLDRLGKKYHGRAEVGKVNVDEEGQIIKDLDVQNIPTIIFFRKGKEIDRLPGCVTYGYLCRRLDKYLAPKSGKETKNRGKT